MGRCRATRAAGIAIATAVIGASASFAQGTESSSSPSGVLNLTTSVIADTNADLDPVSPGTTVTVAEILSLSILSETRNQVLSFTLGGAIEAEKEPGGGNSSGFVDPSVLLSYSRNSANAEFELSASYRSSDVSDTVSDEDLTPEDLIVDSGTVRDYGASVGFRYGIGAPLELGFSAATSVLDYSDTTDPDLIDNTRNTFGISADLRFSPVTSATAEIGVTQLDETGVGSSDRDTTRYSFALSHELRRALTLSGDVGYSETDTTEAGVLTTEDLVFGGLGLRQELSNGAVTGRIWFENRSDDPDRVSLRVGRELELPDGSLSGGLTLTRATGSDVSLLADLDYTKELPRGELTVALSQSVTTDDDGDDVQLSTLGVGYEQSINSLSSLSLAMDLSRSEDAGSGSITGRTRAGFTATYSRELTADWDLNVGYRRRQYDESGGDKAESDSVFLTLSRGVSLGF